MYLLQFPVPRHMKSMPIPGLCNKRYIKFRPGEMDACIYYWLQLIQEPLDRPIDWNIPQGNKLRNRLNVLLGMCPAIIKIVDCHCRKTLKRPDAFQRDSNRYSNIFLKLKILGCILSVNGYFTKIPQHYDKEITKS